MSPTRTIALRNEAERHVAEFVASMLWNYIENAREMAGIEKGYLSFRTPDFVAEVNGDTLTLGDDEWVEFFFDSVRQEFDAADQDGWETFSNAPVGTEKPARAVLDLLFERYFATPRPGARFAELVARVRRELHAKIVDAEWNRDFEVSLPFGPGPFGHVVPTSHAAEVLSFIRSRVTREGR